MVSGGTLLRMVWTRQDMPAPHVQILRSSVNALRSYTVGLPAARRIAFAKPGQGRPVYVREYLVRK